MLRLFKWLICLIFLVPVAHADEGPVLRLGLFPNLEPRTLTMLYEPLRQHLEKSLGIPVRLYSTPDFLSFASRTQNNSYDIVLTAPHLAYLAMHDAGYTPVASYKRRFQTLLVVPKKLQMSTVEELRGTTVAVPDLNALVTQVGEEMLRRNGLQPSDYTIVAKHGHEGAAMAVLAGEVRAALVGSIPYYQMPAASRAHLQILLRSASFPSQYFLVSKQVSPEQRKNIARALLEFNKSAAGQVMLERSGLQGIVADNGKALNRLEQPAGLVRQRLQQIGNVYK